MVPSRTSNALKKWPFHTTKVSYLIILARICEDIEFLESPTLVYSQYIMKINCFHLTDTKCKRTYNLL